VTDVRQFGDRETRSLDCARCEAMLADAVDGALAPEEQQFFDAHIADCGPCEKLLAEARRGAAWLEMLRTPAPEPPAALLEKILAQTSGSHALHPVSVAHPTPAMAPGYSGSPHGNILPFPRRAVAAMRGGSLGRFVFEPRLAMTAAMAFLSIALTLDLMGVNPMELRAHDLTPSGLHRAFAQLDARAVQYYEGLRVVYELESRVHEFQSVQQNTQDATPAQTQTQQQAPAPVNDQAQPAGDAPADDPAQPENNEQKQSAPAQPQSDNAPAHHRSAPGGSISRREAAPQRTNGSLAAFTRNHARQTAATATAFEDAVAAYAQGDSESDIEAYIGGTSSLVHMAPLQRRSDRMEQRRAA